MLDFYYINITMQTFPVIKTFLLAHKQIRKNLLKLLYFQKKSHIPR